MMPDGGTWNMLRGRDVAEAAQSAMDLMTARNLPWLAIQEAHGYAGALRHLAAGRYDVVMSDSDTGLIVRNDVPHGHGYQVKVTRTGWFTLRGTRTKPLYLTTARVGDLRVASVHAPVSVHWSDAGVLFGPIRRVIAMRQFARSLVRFARSHPGALVIAGDWNATPADRGRYSPHWIARKAGMDVLATVVGTRGEHGAKYDFALIRGCKGIARRDNRMGSDHHAVILRMSP